MKKNILNILKSKGQKKLVATTAYTFSVAKLISDLDFDIILVGDSLGMVIKGENNTLNVTMQDMLYHSSIVSKANHNSFIVADMPFLSCDISIEQAVKNAGALIQKASVDAVKVEGGFSKVETIRRIVGAGIPVMGHLGLNPQKILKMGRYSVQGKTAKEEENLLEASKALVEAGVFVIVLECVPASLAKKITEAVNVPTIGIGAGIHCDGQILVSTDIFGLTDNTPPKFVKTYAKVGDLMKNALSEYKSEVLDGIFPNDKFSY